VRAVVLGPRLIPGTMTKKNYPETIEGRWDILYRDYPEIYDAFSSFPYYPDPISVILSKVSLSGATVLDIGSGAGKSSFWLAKYAHEVIGVEPEASMRAIAERAATAQGVQNVRFVEGEGAAVPLPDESVDAVYSVTAGMRSFQELQRVLRPGGAIVVFDVAPGWYGGELNSVIGEETEDEELSRHLVDDLGFSYEDFENIQEYGTTENILRTYGFIHGRKAIDHLKKTGQTSIRWRWRIHYRYK
jgi:ubiquinone/menaquinone biosynthesis C-methylase UbiE